MPTNRSALSPPWRSRYVNRLPYVDDRFKNCSRVIPRLRRNSGLLSGQIFPTNIGRHSWLHLAVFVRHVFTCVVSSRNQRNESRLLPGRALKATIHFSNAADPFDIGLKGENTAAVLDLHKSRLVRFIPPVAFSQPAVNPEPITRTLQAAVAEWLRYLGVAESVESRDQGKLDTN